MAANTGRRDVEVTIRAKNEASKALDNIAASFGVLVKAQESAETSSGRTGSALQRLGNELGKLNSQAAAADAFDRIKDSVEVANAAVEKLDQTLLETSNQQIQIAQKTTLTEQSFRDLTVAVDASNREFEQAKSITDAAGANLKGYTTSLTEMEAVLARGVKSQATLRKDLTEQEAKLGTLVGKQKEYAEAVSASEAPTKRQTNALEKSNKLVAEQAERVEKARKEFEFSIAVTSRYEDSIEELRNKVDGSQRAFTEAGAAQRVAANNLKEVTTAAGLAERELGSLSTITTQLNRSFDAQTASLSKAQAELGEIAGVAGRAEEAISGIASALQSSLRQGLATSSQQLEEYRADLELAQNRLKTFSDFKVTGPEMDVAIAQANAATQAYERQQAILKQGQQLLADAGSDVRKLGAAQEFLSNEFKKAAIAQSDANAKIEQSRVISERYQREQTILVNALKQTANANRDVASTTTSVGRAQADTAKQTSLVAGAFKSVYGESRTSLSLFQRLRGEILAISASYVGLYGAINGLKGTVNTFRELEAAQSRLVVAFGKDQSVIGNELRFIREESDKLGISYTLLGGQYSRLAIAAKGTNLEGQKTREIFDAVAVAGRVAKLSSEDLEGTFTALTQIISKGTVSMEELRQQLGDRLPGAFELLAKGLGITTGELSKLVAAGELTAERALPALAKALNETFSPALEQAVGGLSGQIGLFENEVNKAQLAIAEGLVPALVVALKSLNEFFKSEQGQNFFKQLGEGIGTVIGYLAELPKYVNEIITVLQLLVGAKIIGGLGQMVVNFQKLRLEMIASGGAVTTLSQGFVVFATVLGNVAKAAVGLIAAIPGIGQVVAAVVVGMGIGVTAAEAYGEALAKLTPEGAKAAASLKEFRDSIDANTARFEAGMSAIEKYAGQTLLTANQIANLTVAERTAYEQGREGLEKYLKTKIAYLESLKSADKLTKEGIASIDATRVQLDKVKKAYDELAKAAILSSNALENNVSTAAQVVIGKLGEIGNSTELAADAITKLVKDFDKLSIIELGDLALAVQSVGERAADSGVKVSEGLGQSLEKLTGDQLLRFQIAAQAAFDEFGRSGENAKVVLEGTLGAAIEKLGVDAGLTGVAFTKAGTEIIKTFEVVATNGTASAQQISASFDAALGQLKTRQEVEALAAQFKILGSDGEISSKQLANGLREVEARLREIDVALDPLASAFEQLGIKSQKALDAARDSAREAFAAIDEGAQAGTKSQGDLVRAFEALVQAERDAVAESTQYDKDRVERQLEQMAAIQGLSAEFAAMGDTAVAATEKAAAGMGQLKEATDDTAEATRLATLSYSELVYEANKGSEAARLLKEQMAASGETAGAAAGGYTNYQTAVTGASDAQTAYSTNLFYSRDAQRQLDAGVSASEVVFRGMGKTVFNTAEQLAAYEKRVDAAAAANDRLTQITRQLQDENDRANSNEAAVAEREHRDRVAEITELLAQQRVGRTELGNLNNADLATGQQALILENQRYAAEKARIEQARAARVAEAATAPKPTNTTTTTTTNQTSTSSTSSVQTVKIEITLNGLGIASIDWAKVTAANIATLTNEAKEAFARGLFPALQRIAGLG